MVYQLHRDNEEYFRFGRCLGNLHFHKAIELIYCIQTQKPIVVGTSETLLDEGELLFVPPLVPHMYPPIREHKSLCVVMPVAFSDVLEAQLGDKAFSEYILKDKAVAADIFHHMCMLENCGSAFLKQSLYTYILAVGLKHLPTKAADEAAKGDFTVEVLRYLSKHSSEKLTSKDVAKALGYNPCYFSSRFNQTFKCSFTAYLAAVRIQKAIPLLGKAPTAQIAEQVGFSNMQSFYQNFKKVTGKTPQKYAAPQKP